MTGAVLPRTWTCAGGKANDAAHSAKDAWGNMSAAGRAEVLNAVADAIAKNWDILAVAESWENGKPVRETLAADISLVVDHFRYFAAAARAEEGRTTAIDKALVAYHFREPSGVVGQNIPFNFPLLMAAWKLAPALAAGNCSVLKPASPTAWSILKLMDIIEDVGPANVINVVKPLPSTMRRGCGATSLASWRAGDAEVVHASGLDHTRGPDTSAADPS
jgi:aldehyde dehydrogenase